MHFNNSQQGEEEIIQGYWMDKGQLLGKGSFGEVVRAKIVSADNSVLQCCVKILNLQGINEKRRQLYQREKSILTQLKDLENPNLVKVYHVVEKKNDMFLFMEECNQGDLKQYLFQLSQENQSVRLEEVVKYFGQILNGMKTLIDQNIIHRDLKPENILLHDGVLKVVNKLISKLTDFGMGRVLEGSNTFQMISSVGSPLYSAPQILFGKPYTSKVDVFSLGIVFYEMIYGRPPFLTTVLNQLKSSLNHLQHKPWKCPLESKFLTVPAVPNDLRILIEQMIVYDEEKRIGWPELFAHQRFRQFVTQKLIRILTSQPPSTPGKSIHGKAKIQIVNDDSSTQPNSTSSSNQTNELQKSPVEQTETEEQKNNGQPLTNDENQKPNNQKQSGETQQQQPQASAPIRLVNRQTNYNPAPIIPTDKQQQEPISQVTIPQRSITHYRAPQQKLFCNTTIRLTQNTASLQDSMFNANVLSVAQPGQGKLSKVDRIWRFTSFLIQKSELAWQTVQSIGQFQCTKQLNTEPNWHFLLYGLTGYRLYLLYTCYGLTSNIPSDVSPSLFQAFPLEKLSAAMAQFSQSKEEKFTDLRIQISEFFGDTFQLYQNQNRDLVQYFQFAFQDRSTYAYNLLSQSIRDFSPFYQLFWQQYRNFYRQRLLIQQNVLYPGEYLQLIYALEKLFAIEHLFPTGFYYSRDLDTIILTPHDDQLVDEILQMRSKYQ